METTVLTEVLGLTTKPTVSPHAIPHGSLSQDIKPSGALAPSATMLTHNGQTEQAFPFAQVVERIALGKLKAGGFVRERCNLNPEKLVASVRSQYRSEFAAIYLKGARVPTHVEEKIRDAVGNYITGKLAATITAANSISSRHSLTYRKPRLGEDNESAMWLEQVVNTGENRISFEEQHFACNLEIGRLERRLKDLRAKPNPDHELEKKYTERLNRQERELTYLEGEIKAQKEVAQ